MAEVATARKQLSELIAKGGSTSEGLKSLEEQVAGFEGVATRGRGRGGAQQGLNFGMIVSSFAGLFTILHETDMPPTSQTISAVKETNDQLSDLASKWNVLKTKITAGTK